MAAPCRRACLARLNKRLLQIMHKATRWAGRASLRHYMTSSSNILKLADRGIFQNVFPSDSTPELHKRLVGSPQCMYCGFDPTADSLHIGNLLAVIALLHGQRAGHDVIAVLGGATAKIGDPTGRTRERSALEPDVIQHNISTIAESLQRIFHNHQSHFWSGHRELRPAKVLNNNDWYSSHTIIDFLAIMGRHFRMGDMLGRTSVQTRLNSPEGMSLTEFTYPVFQSYDWLHLYKTFNCTIQIGGNDQTGNIMAGRDLISRISKEPVFGLTVPLIKSTTGDKLGKTAGNAVWLNPDKTSPFELYQFFINLPDTDVEFFLKLFTFLSDAEIAEALKKHLKEPEARVGQKKIAESVTSLVHGVNGLESAQRCTEVLFGKSPKALAEISEQELQDLFKNSPTCDLYLDPGTTVLDAVMKAKCFPREVDADRVIKAGGVYLNHQRITEPMAVLIPGQHILNNNTTLVRIGKKNYYIIRWLG